MKTTLKQITKNVEIIGNGQVWAARKIEGGSVINSWNSKATATKRAKLIQEEIDAGYIAAK
tara:strand:+ start:1025 stop:1207 length:183 start_codon:yes stop_codon:yes gene_type:complete